MRSLAEHLDAINELLPALNDGFFIESYDGNSERLVILGTRDVCFHRDLVIVSSGATEVRFVPTFSANRIRLSKQESGQDVLDFFVDGNVTLSIRGGIFEFESNHI
jgi:hypothetical protein